MLFVEHMILGLERWSAPPVLMLLVLLLLFNTKVDRKCNIEYVEVFAGAAEISKACLANGMVGSSHDISYGPHFDLCGRAGFLCPGFGLVLLCGCTGSNQLMWGSRC